MAWLVVVGQGLDLDIFTKLFCGSRSPPKFENHWYKATEIRREPSVLMFEQLHLVGEETKGKRKKGNTKVKNNKQSANHYD